MRQLSIVLGLALLVTLGASPAGAIPNAGNGGGEIFEVSGPLAPVTCSGGEVLTGFQTGYVKVNSINNKNKVENWTRHGELVYTTDGGDTWSFRINGANWFTVTPEFVGTETGRGVVRFLSPSGPVFFAYAGHVTLDFGGGSPPEVSGNDMGSVADLACDALT